jgi:signal transduction histidine kinase
VAADGPLPPAGGGAGRARGAGNLRLRVFLALMAMALLPTALVLTAGTLALNRVMTGAGTAGPWDEVAASGRLLLEEIDTRHPGDSVLQAVAREHRETLASSLRFSRIYALVAGRFAPLLPLAALTLALLVSIPALLLARTLSRGVARPVRELAGWTGLIARGEPLPPDAKHRGLGSVKEIETLRSALRRMDAELRASRRREVDSARLRSWTEMARRVAHELKNPLTPMRMAAMTVARQADPRASAAGEVLLEEIQRLDEMARSFAQFGRLPEGPLSEVDVEELLQTVARRTARPGLAVAVEAAPDLPRIHGRHEPLVRVFTNLVVNALEAVESAGLRAGTPATDSPDAAVVVRAGADAGEGSREGGVRIEVHDRGPGIPEPLLEGIWTPDFTTRSRGSGIGLALVRQTVEAHGGKVSVENSPDGGALFTVLLPLRPPGDEAGTA